MLTAGGSFDYLGTNQLLSTLEKDEDLLQNIKFTLCLDSLSSSDLMYMHTARFSKQPAAKKIFQVLRWP